MPDTKNPGPLLVSYGNGDINALPTEWRARMGFRQEDQQMPLGYILETPPPTEPPEPVPFPVISENRLIQTRTDERKRTSVILNPPPTNGGIVPPGGGPPDSWMLVSEERIPNGQVAIRTRAFVPEGSHLVLTDDMLQAEQRNLGIGLDQIVLTAPLPGPEIVDTKWDEIASLVSTVKRRKLIAEIVDGETIVGGVWRQTSREGETATVASEVVVTRNLPSSSIESTKFDDQSTLVTTVKTKKEAATIVDGETIVGNVWTKIYHEGETGLVAVEIAESRTLPGPTIISWRIEDNGTLVTIAKTKKLTANIVEGENATASLWTKVYGEGETELISTEIVETRALPTPAVPTSRFDDDSTVVNITRQRRLASTIVTEEIVTPTLWTKRYKEAESGLIATQVEEIRALPGATIISTHYDSDNTLVTIAKTKKRADQFTDSESYNPTTQVWTRRYREGLTGNVAIEVVESRVLPGRPVTSFRLDDDGATVTIVKTKELLDNIPKGEFADDVLWTKITAEGETELFATEVVETRALGGPAVTSFRIDDDGAVVTFVKTKKRIGLVNEREEVSATLWTKVYAEQVTAKVANEVVETRGLGSSAPTVTSTRIDRDGLVIDASRVKKKADTITSFEIGTTTSWTRKFAENVDGLVATEVTETAVLPGPSIVSTRIEDDGRFTTITKQRRFFSDITTDESVVNNQWIKVYKEGESGKLATQVTESRGVAPQAGNVVPSAHIDQDLVEVTTTKAIKTHANINVGVTLIGGIITKTEKKEVSDLVGEEIKSTQPVFDSVKFGVSIENPLPQEFRSLGKVTEEVHVVAGQAVVPALLASELEKSQEQVNALQKRTVVKAIDTAALPVAYAGKEISLDWGGVLLSTEKKLALFNDASVDITITDVETPGIVRNKLERFGGYKVREKATVSGGFPILSGGDVDVEHGLLLPYTQQVVAAGALPGYIGNTATEIKPLDAARSLKTIRTVNTANLNSFKMVFPSTTDVSFPPQLLSITAIDAGTGGGVGAYSETATYTLVGQGNGQAHLDGTANSSSHSAMDVVPVIKQVWGQNIACTHWLFFMSGPVISYAGVLAKLRGPTFLNDPTLAAWPKFRPQSCSITCVGSSGKASARAKKWWSDTITANSLGVPTRGGSARTAGAGTSVEHDINVKSVTIPPTIHGAITIANATRNSAVYNALAQVNLGGITSASANSQSGSHVYPTSFAATTGTAAIPTTGNFIHRMRIEPYKFGYFKIDCEVVNASSW